MLRAGLVLVTGWLAVLLAAGAVQAAPMGSDIPTQAAYLAQKLRDNPVYISDQLPRAVPRSTAPAFAREARRLGVPTYVVVLPYTSAGGLGSGLLAQVHDRLGRKGLYVSLSELGLGDVQTYGVSVPGAADASTATMYEMPHDATARESFQHFVDVLTSGQAHQRAEKGRDEYGGAYNRNEPPKLHTDPVDRENQSFLTGAVVVGVPLAALLITSYAMRRRRIRRADSPAASNGSGSSDSSGGSGGSGGSRGGKKNAAGSTSAGAKVSFAKGDEPKKAGGVKSSPPHAAGAETGPPKTTGSTKTTSAKTSSAQTGGIKDGRSKAGSTHPSGTKSSGTKSGAAKTGSTKPGSTKHGTHKTTNRPGSTSRPGSNSRPGSASRPTSSSREQSFPLLLGALVLAGLLAFAASLVFHDTTSGDGSVPTAADMRARIDRVADGLRRDPLYVDPESPSPLDATQRSQLHGQLSALHVTALVTALPTSMDDESGGNADLLAKSLHDRLHRESLFVLANPTSGSLDVINYGTHVDAGYLFNRPHDLQYSDGGSALGPRLSKLLTYLDKAPASKTAGSPNAPSPASDPVAAQKLPGLFTGDFGPGLFSGSLAALLLFGVVVAVWAIVRWLAGLRRPAGAGAAPEAPVEPRPAWLRRTARLEVAALTTALEPTAMAEESRRRAWECLDAAALLIDGDSDGLIDADATPVGLACAITLARVGRTAVQDPAAAEYVCYRNPLHGAATEREQKRPAGGGKPVSMPVCAACRETPGAVLRLPGSDGHGRRGHAAYPTLPGPLATLADGARIDQLTRDVREYFGVQ
ncbi:hypothetical protein [Streptomyces albospinus]|uniref:hypothetical protein n=1 Tax=Streptomyces albospinus TaxID=285515 RepID=UPI00166FE67E|nr:hypothetical protein [Streptomyces albospinus]